MSVEVSSPHIASTTFEGWGVPDFTEPKRQTEHNRDIIKRIGEMPHGHYVRFLGKDALLSELDNPDALFVSKPEFSEGKEATKQGVYFGDIFHRTSSQPARSTFVAVKPYNAKLVEFGTTGEGAVVHDWAVNTYLNALRPGLAFQPIGVWRDGTIPQLVTKYVDGAASLDNVFKADGKKGIASQDRARFGLELGQYGTGVGHGVRITLGDNPPQNIATSYDNPLIFNDTTSFRRFGKSPHQTDVAMLDDVGDYVKGVFDKSSSSPDMRAHAVRLLKDTDYVRRLYGKYVEGARYGARIAGYDRSGPLITESVYLKTVANLVNHFERQGWS